MPTLIPSPTVIPAAGEPPKVIAEYVGRASHRSDDLSVAVMRSPAGWREPGQVGQFDEYTLVLSGRLLVDHADGRLDVGEDEAVCVGAGEWVRYSTPDGARYVSVCVPAFAPERVRRDDS